MPFLLVFYRGPYKFLLIENEHINARMSTKMAWHDIHFVSL